MSDVRGIIKYRDRARQINDFSSMRYCRGITPTDIDGAFEFDGKLFVFFEVKYGEKDLDYGQRLFLERVCSVFNAAHKPTLCIHARHLVRNPNDDVDVAKSIVVKYYDARMKWLNPPKPVTVRYMCDRFIEKYGSKEWIV